MMLHTKVLFSAFSCFLRISLEREIFSKNKKGISMSEFLTVKEVALLLRVDNSTVRRWIKRGVLAAVTLPHTGIRQVFRVRRSTLETLLA